MKFELDFAMDNQDTLGIDSMFLVLCMQIAEDYQTILRQHVMPEFKNSEGLNLREMRVLRCISRDKFPLTGAQIAERLRYDPATVTRAIKRLDSANKITRRPCPTDSRSEFIEATDDGEALANRFRDQFRSVTRILSDMQGESFSDTEIEQFVNTSRKLSRRVHSMSKIRPVEYAQLKNIA